MKFAAEVSRHTIQQSIGCHVSEKNLETLLEVSQVSRHRAGEYLFREGEPHGDMYVVLEGKVDLLMTIPGRGARRILTVGSGELLAWSAVVGVPRQHDTPARPGGEADTRMNATPRAESRPNDDGKSVSDGAHDPLSEAAGVVARVSSLPKTLPSMTCDAVCKTDCVLLRLSGPLLGERFSAHPEFGFEFMQWLAAGLAKRLTATRLQLLDLFAHESQR